MRLPSRLSGHLFSRSDILKEDHDDFINAPDDDDFSNCQIEFNVMTFDKTNKFQAENVTTCIHT